MKWILFSFFSMVVLVSVLLIAAGFDIPAGFEFTGSEGPTVATQAPPTATP